MFRPREVVVKYDSYCGRGRHKKYPAIVQRSRSPFYCVLNDLSATFINTDENYASFRVDRGVVYVIFSRKYYSIVPHTNGVHYRCKYRRSSIMCA